MVSRPTAAVDPVLAEETRERKETLETAKKLFTDGKYEESLALSRKVLARSPNNEQARQYAQMAENALTGKEEARRKSDEADKALGEGQAAFAAGKYEEARKKADEALALDGGKVEAQQLRDQARDEDRGRGSRRRCRAEEAEADRGAPPPGRPSTGRRAHGEWSEPPLPPRRPPSRRPRCSACSSIRRSPKGT